ncbi:MAG: HEAT repeat domain-containing protein [Myxococcales bacterium]
MWGNLVAMHPVLRSCALCLLIVSADASAQPVESRLDLRARWGPELAARLVSSSDLDTRRRGLARAASLASPEALAVLVDATAPTGAARTDPRAMLEAVRALSHFVREPSSRLALSLLASASVPSQPRTSPATPRDLEEVDLAAARTELARRTATLVLARSREPRALETLLALARSTGPGRLAAQQALIAFPPRHPSTLAFPLANQAMLRIATATGDLRLVDAVRAAARSDDPDVVVSAFAALASFGDTASVPLIKEALAHREPRLRVAAAEALVSLAPQDHIEAVASLIGDDATATSGVALAEKAFGESIVKALTARVAASSHQREAAVAALGHQPSPRAVQALEVFLQDPWLQGDTAHALARSPNPDAMKALERLATSSRRLAVRAYVLRRTAYREHSALLHGLVDALAEASDANDRAVGLAAQIVFGERRVTRALSDPDPRVRRSVALAALAFPDNLPLLRQRLAVETDATTRVVLALGLIDGDSDVPTGWLRERTETGGADASLALMALARRCESADTVTSFLRSRNAYVRVHAAFGLGQSAARDAAGALAGAYAYEAEPTVRRALIASLASRTGDDVHAPVRLEALTLARDLDPDPAVRHLASRALAGLSPAPLFAPSVTDITWLRLANVDGKPPSSAFLGALVQADGLVIPIAFDDDGYALVPATPSGSARLLLTPRPVDYSSQ